VASLLLCERGRGTSAVSLAALGCFLRPESVLTVAILSVRAMLSGSKGAALRTVASGVAILGSGLTLIWLVYGQPLPQSVVAKSARAHVGVLDVVHQLLAPDPIAVFALPLATVGVVLSARRPGVLRLLAIWLADYLLAYVTAGPKMWSWYALPVQYCIAVFAAVGTARALSLAALLPHVAAGSLGKMAVNCGSCRNLPQ
jgi:hypothetical protein